MSTVDLVLIGRNEGARLVAALDAAVNFLLDVSNHTSVAPTFFAHYDHTTGLFVPDKTISPVVPDISEDTVKAVFEQRSRKNRPGTLTLHSRFANDATPKPWLLT